MELHPKYDSDIETDDPIYTCQECVKRFMIHVIRLSGPGMVTLISVSVCAQLCLMLCNTLDCSPPDSSVHGIFQARILEWVAISSSRGSCQPQMCVSCISCIGRWILYHWATREVPISSSIWKYYGKRKYILGEENLGMETSLGKQAM